MDFTVNSKIKHSVIDFKPISHRLCTLRIRGKCNNLGLVCAQAPTEEKVNILKISFMRNNIRIIQGDFSTKVGFEDQDRSVGCMRKVMIMD
jgi:hypothetical protein